MATNVLNEKEEINILILGETGVGKSTWINGIYNYFMYESLDDASKKDIKVPIPSKFFCHGKTIYVGNKSSNEDTSATGESCTQGPRHYEMIFENFKINMIDTPGIGDSRGVEQDKINFDNILAFLTNFKTLHGVCILLKPNMSRNTLWFRFCIQELLIHLHSSIVKNIVFCFTNARQSFYLPGDSLPVLQEYLKQRKIPLEADPKKNCFCFDNEAFRYLACLQNGVEDIEKFFTMYAESWNFAREETLKLLDYICKCPPHQIKDTISINNAREAILQLGRPLAEIVNNIIPDRVQKAKDVQKKLDDINHKIGDLEGILKTKVKSFKTKDLDHARTVCTDKDCIATVYDESTKTSRIVYKQICHNKCTITGVATQTANDERLSKCFAFHVKQGLYLMKALNLSTQEEIPGFKRTECNDTNCPAFEGEPHGHFSYDREAVLPQLSEEQKQEYELKISDKCQKCRHSYKQHMHITYELQECWVKMIDENSEKEIRGKKTEKEKEEKIRRDMKTLLEEIKEEKEFIFQSLIQFSAFIRDNTLVVYNDAYDEVVEMFIKDEVAKGSERSNDTLNRLKNDQKIYREKKKAFDEAANKAQDIKSSTTPDQILKEVEKLKRLKHCGGMLEEALTGINNAKKKQLESTRILQEQQAKERVKIRRRGAETGGGLSLLGAVSGGWKTFKSFIKWK